MCHTSHTVELFLNPSRPPHRGRIPAFMVPVYGYRKGTSAGRCFVSAYQGENTMMKTLIVAGATLAFVTVAGAADLPHPQPVYKAEPAPVVGKMPIGKDPIGKGPIGKEPVVTRAY